MKKRLFALLSCAALAAASITGCSSQKPAESAAASAEAESTTGAPSKEVGDYKIALITMDSIDQHWVTLNEGAQEEAKELGVTVSFMSPNTKDDAQQIECVNNAVAGGYQAIIVAANGPDAISSALKEAASTGVKIVYVDSPAKILQDDANVDLKERDIESKCLKLLLEQQPVASDLRKISSALKMITDLERIGDQAGDIAEIIKTADLLEPVKATRLGEMAKAVASMVRESIESFANEDLRKTKEVIAYDDVIDDMFSQVKKELADGILNGGATQEQILDILMIAKYYERIGDHATNIAEWAEYAITGVHRNSELEDHL